MRFRNSLRLLMENFKHVYKILAYKLIVALVAAALCSAFVVPEIMDIWNSDAVQGLLQNVKDFFKALFAADAAALTAEKDAIVGENGSLSQVVSLLSSMTVEIVLTCVGCVLVYLVTRFVDTLCYFATGSVLNDKMATYAETSFWNAYVSNLGKASVYAALYVPVVFLFDALTVLLGIGLLSFLPIFPALFAVMTLVVACQALKLTFTSHWLPGMTTDGKKLSASLRYENSTERRQRLKVFSTYLVTVYLVIIINVIAAVCTLGSALLLTVPASYFLFICQQYVNYYTMKGKKYFLTYERIASNPDRGDSEHFFDYIDETAEEKTEE